MKTVQSPTRVHWKNSQFCMYNKQTLQSSLGSIVIEQRAASVCHDPALERMQEHLGSRDAWRRCDEEQVRDARDTKAGKQDAEGTPFACGNVREYCEAEREVAASEGREEGRLAPRRVPQAEEVCL